MQILVTMLVVALAAAGAKPKPKTIPTKDGMALRLTGTDPVMRDRHWRFPPAGGPRVIVVKTLVCVSDKGAVTGVDILQSSGDMDSDRVVIGAASNWTFKPYVLKKKPAPFCFEKQFGP